MKKLLLILLIAVCCVSVFAVDISAGIALHVSLGDGGLSFSGTEIYEAPITLSVSSDNAGAKYKFDLLHPGFMNGAYEASVWCKPIGRLMITLGSTGSNSITDGIMVNDNYLFGLISCTCSTETDIAFDWDLGASYKPAGNFVFLAGEFSIGKAGQNNFFHTDVLSKFDYIDNKLSFNYALAEVTLGHNFDYNDHGSLCYDKTWAANSMEIEYGDESNMFNQISTYNLKDNGDIGCLSVDENVIVGGIRYKYYTEGSKEQQNGLYGYTSAKFTNYEYGNNIVLLNSEINRNGAYNFVRDTFIYDNYTFKSYVAFNFDWSDGQLDATLSETNNKISDNHEGKTYNLEFKYLNKAENAAWDNGWWLKPSVGGSVGILNYVFTGEVSRNSLKESHWNTSVKSTVNF